MSSPAQLPPGASIPGQSALVAHASIMCVVFVLLLPIGALTTRSPIKVRVTRLHAPWQAVTVALAVAGMGLGIHVARTRGLPFGSTPHIILGLVIVGCLVVVQPLLGILQHLNFRKSPKRGFFGWVHLILGRLLLILGLVNGARGFVLARDNHNTPYYVVLGVVCAVYVGILIWDWLLPKRLSIPFRSKTKREGGEPQG